MKKMRIASLASQQGSYYVGILIFAMVVLLMVCGMKIVPAYMDNNIVVSTVEAMDSGGQLRSMTVTQMRSELQRNLILNNIRDFNSGDVTITREGDMEYVDINYEKRIHLFANLDVVVTFSERVPKS